MGVPKLTVLGRADAARPALTHRESNKVDGIDKRVVANR